LLPTIVHRIYNERIIGLHPGRPVLPWRPPIRDFYGIGKAWNIRPTLNVSSGSPKQAPVDSSIRPARRGTIRVKLFVIRRHRKTNFNMERVSLYLVDSGSDKLPNICHAFREQDRRLCLSERRYLCSVVLGFCVPQAPDTVLFVPLTYSFTRTAGQGKIPGYRIFLHRQLFPRIRRRLLYQQSAKAPLFAIAVINPISEGR